MNPSPPKWADRFLQWYCNPDLLEEIQGDVYELYERRLKNSGQNGANRMYCWDVLRFFRWSNIRRRQNKTQNSNNLPMLKNYIKVGFRNLSKHWVTSTINIFGLSIAIGCAITTFIFIDNQLHMDSFHKNGANIYQVINHVRNENQVEMWGGSPILLGPALKSEYPNIEQVVRMEYQRGSVRHDNNVFSELVTFADPEFLQMFDFSLRAGNRKSLFQKEGIVISDRMAKKYFGNNDPIGKTVSIKYSNGVSQSYFINGVFEKTPYNASFQPQILIPMSNFFDLNFQENYGWDYLANATFISIKPESETGIFDMDKYRELYNKANSKWPIEQFEFIALHGLSLRGYDITGDITKGGHPAGRLALSVIAFFLLMIACFNYMNIAVSSATKRLKEIALRKVMGSARRNIISQFLIENIILCAFALALGALLSYFLFLPGFDMMVPEMEFPFTFSSITNMVGFFGLLLLLVGFISGAYPAFYISRFEPVHIFRGNEKFGSKNLLSKILLTFQLFLAITTVVGCFVFADNAMYISKRGWGYDPEGIISVRVNNASEFQALRNESLKNSAIEMSAGSYGQVAIFDPATTLDYLDKQFTMIRYKVGVGYLETNNIRLKEGRFFEQENEHNSIVVNETFVNKMEWKDPLNESIVQDSVIRNVIGVVEDFRHDFFYIDVYPVIFTSGADEDFNYLTVRTASEDEITVNNYLKNAWQKIAPDDPYRSAFQSDVFEEDYYENKSNTVLILIISGIAILLACLGLFGLLSFNLQKRMKEFGVRKVLGADPLNIVKLANKEYSWILIVAFLIGAPMGYFLMSQLVAQIYPDPKNIGMVPFISAVVIILLTFAITVSSQIWKATKVNPAEILRSE